MYVKETGIPFVPGPGRPQNSRKNELLIFVHNLEVGDSFKHDNRNQIPSIAGKLKYKLATKKLHGDTHLYRTWRIA